MYADWTRHDINYFFEQVAVHWNTFNGRTLIHVVLSLLLLCQEHLYSIVIPLVIFFSAFLFHKQIKPEANIYERIAIGGFCLIAFSGIPYMYHKETVIWMAGGINYIFPLILISSAYFLYNKAKSNNKYIVPAVIVLLLAGATTEQWGMYIIGLLVMTTFFDILDKKKYEWKKDLLFLIPAVIGYITIFLSPGTNNRIENPNSLQTNFIEGFFNNNFWLAGIIPPIFIIVIMLLFALLGFSKKYRPLLFGIPITICNAVLYTYGICNLASIIFLFYIAFISVIFFKNKETREYGKLIVCGYGTFFMLSIVSAQSRGCVPFLITIIIVLSSLYIDLLLTHPLKVKIIPTAIAGLFTINCLITNQATYSSFKATEDAYSKPLYEDLLKVKDTGTLNFNFDATKTDSLFSEYRYCTALEIGYHTNEEYFSYFGFSDIKYHHISEEDDVSDISYNGHSYQIPIINENEKVYVPALATVYKDKTECGAFLR